MKTTPIDFSLYPNGLCFILPILTLFQYYMYANYTKIFAQNAMEGSRVQLSVIVMVFNVLVMEMNNNTEFNLL